MYKKIIFNNLIVSALLMLAFASCNSDDSKAKLLPADMVENPITAGKEADLSDLPVMTFEKVEHDFGKIKNGEVVSFGFKFKNTGKSELIISKVSTSCGCTASDYPKDPVKPGKEGVITLTFKSEGRTGIQNKMATVVSNTQPNSNVLKIRAVVLE